MKQLYRYNNNKHTSKKAYIATITFLRRSGSCCDLQSLARESPPCSLGFQLEVPSIKSSYVATRNDQILQFTSNT